MELLGRTFQAPSATRQTDVIYTDLLKAFEVVQHSLLLYKLILIRLRFNLLALIRSYISTRTQCILFDGYVSHTINGILEALGGSHHDPLLFLFFIDELASHAKYPTLRIPH